MGVGFSGWNQSDFQIIASDNTFKLNTPFPFKGKQFVWSGKKENPREPSGSRNEMMFKGEQEGLSF